MCSTIYGKANPLRDLKTLVERCDSVLSQSFATHTEKIREANIVFGEKSIKAQTVEVEYTIPIILALGELVIAFRQYTKMLEKELEKKSKAKHDNRRKKKLD